MNIWVDADACPNVIKEILFRAAHRRGIPLTLVANQPVRVPRSPHIRAVQVASGFDVEQLKVGQTVELVLETLHQDGDIDKVTWKWKPVTV